MKRQQVYGVDDSAAHPAADGWTWDDQQAVVYAFLAWFLPMIHWG